MKKQKLEVSHGAVVHPTQTVYCGAAAAVGKATSGSTFGFKREHRDILVRRGAH